MCGFGCGVTTAVIGGALVVLITVFNFAFLPGIIENAIINEVVLLDDSIQMERFEEIPFPLDFKVYLFNISNAEEVLAGAQPHVQELGPWVYKLYRERLVEGKDDDTITYRMLDHYEFDPEASFPFTEDDIVTVANTPYQAILQSAEALLPNLLGVLNTASNGIFGAYNSPILTISFREIAFEGVKICENPGIVSSVACVAIRQLSADTPNIVEVDGALQFTLFGYRKDPTNLFVVSRGLSDESTLGEIIEWNHAPELPYWVPTVGNNVCNMLNGTDSGLFSPFISKEYSRFAFNADICRSVEVRYQYETDVDGLLVYRFASDERLLDNHEGCWCVNETVGITGPDGCLLPGTMEMNSCLGAPLVMSYPHFLYGDPTYLNGVTGLSPDSNSHMIYMDMEPNTGTVLRGAKRAQFNVFLRPIPSITATQNLRTTLTPMFWIEESVVVPEEYVELIRSSLFLAFTVLGIAVPVVIAASALVMVAGLGCIWQSRRRKPTLA